MSQSVKYGCEQIQGGIILYEWEPESNSQWEKPLVGIQDKA